MRMTLAPATQLPRKTIVSPNGVMTFTGQSATFDCRVAGKTAGTTPSVEDTYRTLEQFLNLFPEANGVEWMDICRVPHQGSGLEAPFSGEKEGMDGFWYALNCTLWTPVFIRESGNGRRKLLGMEQQAWARELAG